MHQDIKIKVCGMRDPANIREVSRLKPDYMGFIFYPGSKRCVGNPHPDLFKNVDQDIHKTAVFVNEQTDKIIRLAAFYEFSFVQLHGDEPVRDCSFLKEQGLKVIKAFRISNKRDLNTVIDYQHACDFFLFDTGGEERGGTGRKFDWTVLENFDSPLPVFLSGGIGRDDAGLLKHTGLGNLHAADINSRFEIMPGLKNVEDIRYFMKQLKPYNEEHD